MTEGRSVDYESLGAQVEALLHDETDVMANSANFVGLVYNALPDVNWLGIYVLRDEELVLGPFQGNPACVRIPIGQGVCGTAARDRKTIRVADVHEFDGHIVCDPASRSEVVVPLVAGGRLLGVGRIQPEAQSQSGPASGGRDAGLLRGKLHTPTFFVASPYG